MLGGGKLLLLLLLLKRRRRRLLLLLKRGPGRHLLLPAVLQLLLGCGVLQFQIPLVSNPLEALLLKECHFLFHLSPAQILLLLPHGCHSRFGPAQKKKPQPETKHR